MEYLPKRRRKGLPLPFGWYVSPLDPYILIPDPPKIEALEYAFKQRAKYKTPYRDCTQWLHAATGQLMTPGGFMRSYKAWVNRINKEKYQIVRRRMKKAREDQKKEVAEKYFQYTVITDDKDSTTAVAYQKLRDIWSPSRKKKKKQKR